MIGTRAEPYERAPADWGENGVPYGSFCTCHRCGLTTRSTVNFDFRAKAPGDLLTCDRCEGISTIEVAHTIESLFDVGELEAEPLADGTVP